MHIFPSILEFIKQESDPGHDINLFSEYTVFLSHDSFLFIFCLLFCAFQHMVFSLFTGCCILKHQLCFDSESLSILQIRIEQVHL